MTRDNIQELLNLLEFEQDGKVYTKRYETIRNKLEQNMLC